MTTNALPNVSVPITANIPIAVRDFLAANTDVSDYFRDNIVSYRRLDWSTGNLPAVSIYLSSSRWESPLGWLTGDVTAEIGLAAQYIRGNLASQTNLTADMISLVLNDRALIQFARLTNPGLVNLDFSNEWEYRKAAASDAIKNQNSAYVLRGRLLFRVNILEYYKSIQTGDQFETCTVDVIPV